MSGALHALAAYCGIGDAYHDTWGNRHETSDATRVALLAAMHLPTEQVVNDPGSLLESLLERDKTAGLPAVLVVREQATLHLPQAPARAQWRLFLENGQSLQGTVPDEGGLSLAAPHPIGYHRLTIHHAAGQHALPVIVVPARCYQPPALAGRGRVWGITVQLYSLRSRRNWGIGDFTDLADLLDFTAEAGGAVVGVNPLHALFPDNPLHISPYSPSHRSFIDVLYLDVETVPELSHCEAARRRLASADFQARLQRLREADRVDYAGVAEAKLSILRLLWACFKDAGGKRAAEFESWRRQQGKSLEQFALYEAIQSHFRATDPAIWGWPVWPAEWRDPDGARASGFAAMHPDAIAWHAWLQWLSDSQLHAAAERGERAGLQVGIYLDLAIGANPGGAEAWRWQQVFAAGAHTGAPPDEINSVGQDWGLPPLAPERLTQAAYAPLVDILRANMKHAGALRIDHVMGLQRLFWVPTGMKASAGAYVGYPFEDLLGIVALESVRNRCLVIGEDLGTVPEGFRERLAEAGVISYHPMIFEREPDGQFRLPADYPVQALVAASTHDLPTLRGFWQGLDLDIRARLDLFPCEELHQRLLTERGWDRGRLLWALERENLEPPGLGKDPAVMPDITTPAVSAVHAYLARSSSQLMVIQAEDLLGGADQANLPGTLEDKHPNWQQRLPVTLEDWPRHPRCQAVLAAVRRERP